MYLAAMFIEVVHNAWHQLLPHFTWLFTVCHHHHHMSGRIIIMVISHTTLSFALVKLIYTILICYACMLLATQNGGLLLCLHSAMPYA